MNQIAHVVASAWPGHRTVAELHGSLPMGGFVHATPIHAFDVPAPQLRLQPRLELRPERRDIELGGLLAFVINDVLAEDEADAIVTAT